MLFLWKGNLSINERNLLNALIHFVSSAHFFRQGDLQKLLVYIKFGKTPEASSCSPVSLPAGREHLSLFMDYVSFVMLMHYQHNGDKQHHQADHHHQRNHLLVHQLEKSFLHLGAVAF